MFTLFLAGSGYKEIADHLNRPGGPPPPSHVDSKRNTAGKWSKSTIRSILENHAYTGRLYWGRLDFRAVKQGEGPLVRRSPEDWIEAEQRHEALVSEEDFERVQTEMQALVSSAFNQAKDLSDVCATTAIAGAGFEPATFGL